MNVKQLKDLFYEEVGRHGFSFNKWYDFEFNNNKFQMAENSKGYLHVRIRTTQNLRDPEGNIIDSWPAWKHYRVNKKNQLVEVDVYKIDEGEVA